MDVRDVTYGIAVRRTEKYVGCARTVFYMGIVPFSIDVDILKYIYIWGVVAVMVNSSVPPTALKPPALHTLHTTKTQVIGS